MNMMSDEAIIGSVTVLSTNQTCSKTLVTNLIAVLMRRAIGSEKGVPPAAQKWILQNSISTEDQGSHALFSCDEESDNGN